MLWLDDEVIHWVEFRYEHVYKVYKRCGIIGHSTTHCPHLNLDIERMIREQMEIINRRFNMEAGMIYNISYSLKTFKLFTTRE